MARLNRALPDSYGLSLTVHVPTASAANPIEQNTPLVWVDTSSNNAAPAAAGDVIQLRAKHTVTDPNQPLGVHVYGFSRLETFPYSGAAPTLGASVTADGAGGVTVAAAANGSRVVHVDVASGTVDVLMP